MTVLRDKALLAFIVSNTITVPPSPPHPTEYISWQWSWRFAAQKNSDTTKQRQKSHCKSINESCAGHLISLSGGDVNWLARFLDLNLSDFLIRNYLKTKMFKHRLRTPEELKISIRKEIVATQPDILDIVIRNWRIRLNQYIRKQWTIQCSKLKWLKQLKMYKQICLFENVFHRFLRL